MPFVLSPLGRVACLLALSVHLAVTAVAQDAGEARGIDFTRDFDAAFALAGQTGRLVFVDAMATWCKPCLEMDRKVFSDVAVGNYVNEHFVPVKLDMERGVGPRVAGRYNVRAYPTLLILDAEGGEVDRHVGALDAGAFIEFVHRSAEWARKGGDPAPDSYAALDARFRAGVRDTADLLRLIAFGERAVLPATGEYAAAYLAATGDYSSPEAIDLALRYAAVDNALFDELVARRRAYAATVGAYEVESTIARALDDGLFPDGEALGNRRAKALIARAFPAAEARADSTYIRFRMRRAREAGKAKRYGRWALRWQERYPTDDPDELDELVYIFEERLPGWRDEEVAAWRARRDELWGEQSF